VRASQAGTGSGPPRAGAGVSQAAIIVRSVSGTRRPAEGVGYRSCAADTPHRRDGAPKL